MKNTALVVTSIAAPNKVLSELAKGAIDNNWRFYCVGDLKSPSQFELKGCQFISHREQLEDSQFKLSRLLPDNHYARKNHGYLQAISDGAANIVETDDDNSPLENFWEPRCSTTEVELLTGREGWVNVYRYFTDQLVWPRGLPLNCVHSVDDEIELHRKTVFNPVQQFLANGDTDVDAIYRLILSNDVVFEDRDFPISLSKKLWCPFNSQSTTWDSSAFKLLYLPSHCSFRMTDIWRSFVVQACLAANDWYLSFHNASVFQERNEHDLMKDFKDEVPGYMNNESIAEKLSKLQLRRGDEHLLANLLSCYECLISMGLIDDKEEELLEAWAVDIGDLGI